MITAGLPDSVLPVPPGILWAKENRTPTSMTRLFMMVEMPKGARRKFGFRLNSIPAKRSATNASGSGVEYAWLSIEVEVRMAGLDDGRKITFKVEGFDEKEKIGEAVHERFIINEAKFNQRVEAKKT